MKRKQITIGILAHVDAGKTTLSEAILYKTKTIQRLGRVDKKDAFFDTNQMERERGITIFSKQAIANTQAMELTILDTPGHVDFSAEMERTLMVLDYAILVVSGASGVQAHTRTLWTLFEKYEIPVFLFVNKMDQAGVEKERCLAELKKELSDNCIDFTDTASEEFYEEAAMGDEAAMEEYLASMQLEEETIADLIAERKIFPCYFGSALRLEGVEELLSGMERYTREQEYSEAFGARVFKISRDENGTRLSHLKITGGSLKVKEVLTHTKRARTADEENEPVAEKVNQIRKYCGEKYELLQECHAGEICVVTGLAETYAGEGLGAEAFVTTPQIVPVLTYRVVLPEGVDERAMLPKLRILEEEEPQLHVVYLQEHGEIQVQVMGSVQIEILKRQIYDRFQTEVEFDSGRIVYKETIANVVEGVGHFEPLRHYAEAHFLLEPLEPGSGMEFETNCSEDVLDRNWQRLILTHLMEKEHVGVLTGSAITDIRITLVAGKAHQKHTEGGDFRQATYRGVRNGLAKAQSVLLEPYYKFRLEVPEESIGRAMMDIEKMHGTMQSPDMAEGKGILCGRAPVACMQEYAAEVSAYTKGLGHLFVEFGGYYPCHNAEEVIAARGYDFTRDVQNPASSVFCAHGAGFVVEWDEVENYMHLESVFCEQSSREIQTSYPVKREGQSEEWVTVDEVDDIIAKTFFSNKRNKNLPKKKYMSSRKIRPVKERAVSKAASKTEKKEKYLLVDGYNIIHAFDELRELAAVNMDGARGRLQDILCDYQGAKGMEVIAVFDAYRVKGHNTEIFDYHNIHIVFTKEAETADAYIEKFSHENTKKYDITVATSDGLEQMIIRGQGCHLLSAREFYDEIERTKQQIREVIG